MDPERARARLRLLLVGAFLVGCFAASFSAALPSLVHARSLESAAPGAIEVKTRGRRAVTVGTITADDF